MIRKIISTLFNMVSLGPAMFTLSSSLPGSADESNSSIADEDYKRARDYLNTAEQCTAQGNIEGANEALRHAHYCLCNLDTHTNDYASLQAQYYQIKSRLRQLSDSGNQ